MIAVFDPNLEISRLVCAFQSQYHFSKETPPKEEDDDEAERCERSVLLQHQLPVDSYCSFPIFRSIFPQPTTHLAHPLKTVASVQQILDILGHDFGYILELVVQLVQIPGCSRVLVGLLGALNECIKFDECVGS